MLQPSSNLTLLALGKSGTFLIATERWREKDDTAITVANFQHHFTKADKERPRPPGTMVRMPLLPAHLLPLPLAPAIEH
jgi:hypothetical protein